MIVFIIYTRSKKINRMYKKICFTLSEAHRYIFGLNTDKFELVAWHKCHLTKLYAMSKD